jgi:hypothetical protein
MKTLFKALFELVNEREHLAAEKLRCATERRLACIRYYNTIALPHLRVPEE